MSSLTEPRSNGSNIRCCCCRTSKSSDAFTPGERVRHSPRCRECVREKNREFVAANADRLRKANALYYRRNKKRLDAQNKVRYVAKREQYAEARERWWIANRDRINSARRPHKKFNTWQSWVTRLKRHGLTPDDYDRLHEQQDGGCAICHTTEPGKAGGATGPGLVFAVVHCNMTT